MNAINKPNEVSMFKVGDWVGVKDGGNWIDKVTSIEYKKRYDCQWNEYEVEILVFEDGTKLGSGWAIHATPEEIAAGRRIDLETLRDCDTSPNCKKYER